MSSVAGYTVYNTQKTPSLIFDASICSVIYFFLIICILTFAETELVL